MGHKDWVRVSLPGSRTARQHGLSKYTRSGTPSTGNGTGVAHRLLQQESTRNTNAASSPAASHAAF